MEITKEFEVTPEQVFNTIQKSLQQDYFENTGDELSVEKIVEGLQYIKSFGKNKQNKVKVRIKEWKKNQCYGVEFVSNRGTHRMCYQLKAIDSDYTEITYSEELIQSGFFQKANTKFLKLFLKKSFELRMNAQLEALVKQATSN